MLTSGPIVFYCDRCGTRHHLPQPPQVPDQERDRRIREQAIREVIRRLTQGARGPARIGRRVLAWDHSLNAAVRREKLLTLAGSLNVSKARASMAVSDAQEAIANIRNINSEPAQQNPC